MQSPTEIRLSSMNLLKNLLILGLCGSAFSNYPDDHNNEKPCMRMKNTINTIAPICVPNGKDFQPESVANCRKLKDGCPEFNEVECMWYTTTCPVPGNSLMHQVITFPTCRVKYYAKKYTWAEVYYVNQYGTDPKNVFDIVELHRYIKNHKAFPFDQKDWPDNVLDSHGERGIPWTKFDLPPNTNTSPAFTSQYYKPITGIGLIYLCQALVDSNDNCKKSVRDYMEKTYPDGILLKKKPAPSKKEVESSAQIEILITAKCDSVMLNMVKTPVCRVSYERKSVYNFHTPGLVETAVNKSVTQQFLEVHMWQKKDADPKKDGDRAFEIQYGYFNYNPPMDYIP
uniref:Uncharacterized protein n=1 Tax=Cacopsylla melanoneura TaxID=428564 RepID=A0A8D8SQG6_9HEMI